MSSFLIFLGGVGGRIVLTIVFAVIFYGLALWLLKTANDTILVILFVVLAIFGWKALNKIRPDMITIFHGVSALIFYYIFKGLLSIFIGLFVAPFVIGKGISNAIMKSFTE